MPPPRCRSRGPQAARARARSAPRPRCAPASTMRFATHDRHAERGLDRVERLTGSKHQPGRVDSRAAGEGARTGCASGPRPARAGPRRARARALRRPRRRRRRARSMRASRRRYEGVHLVDGHGFAAGVDRELLDLAHQGLAGAAALCHRGARARSAPRRPRGRARSRASEHAPLPWAKRRLAELCIRQPLRPPSRPPSRGRPAVCPAASPKDQQHDRLREEVRERRRHPLGVAVAPALRRPSTST